MEITPKKVSKNHWLLLIQKKLKTERELYPTRQVNHCVGLQYRNKYNGGYWQKIHGGLVPHRNGQHGDACQRNLQSTASHDFANC